MKIKLKYIALAMVISLISLPGMQMGLHLVKERPLNGAFILADKPVLSLKNWNSGTFQEQAERYMKDHAGFRNFLIRLYNQIDFSLFRNANAEGAIVGKDYQLFEYDYIRSRMGLDNPGESFIRKKLGRAKFVQDYLKQEKNIDLVIVFEPGKASFYPEYIPERFSNKKQYPSTYQAYLSVAREMELNFIDLQAYFMQLKPEAPFPLFPKYGTHWSVYGMKYVADSLLRFIEKRKGLNLGSFLSDTLETSRVPRDTDDDVAKTMNLLIPPKREMLAYPVYHFDTAGLIDKPMVLAVADSYYWNIFNTRIPRYLFANEAFWYFNELVYPDNYLQPKHTGDLDLKSEIEKQDFIFLMVTERFVHKFDWTFIDNLYRLYAPEWLTDPVYDNINRIMMHAPWYDELIEKAGSQNISLEEMLIRESKYLIYKEDTAEYMIRFGSSYYRDLISGFPEWMAEIRNKAMDRGISEQEMLQIDALYVFKNRYPGYFELNQGIINTIEVIKQDRLRMDSVATLSSKYFFDRDEILWAYARKIYRENEIRRVSELIRSDEKWLSAVRRKASERGLTLEEMIYMDALWVFEKKLK